ITTKRAATKWMDMNGVRCIGFSFVSVWRTRLQEGGRADWQTQDSDLLLTFRISFAMGPVELLHIGCPPKRWRAGNRPRSAGLSRMTRKTGRGETGGGTPYVAKPSQSGKTDLTR